MREVNFSIPNANKASVGISTALYDRRGLDCTSTLPLINSLNHLAYLTTSSVRVRDTLTLDGGMERLICLLKSGRTRDTMDMWKWNLAFQCVVNVGVRGSERVRTRVVEADMVPVIATILDNYIKVVDKCREKSELKLRSLDDIPNVNAGRHDLGRPSRGTATSFAARQGQQQYIEPRTSRRQPPPPAIEIPPTPQSIASMTDGGPRSTVTSPTDRTPFAAGHRHYPQHLHQHRSQDPRLNSLTSSRQINLQPLPLSHHETAENFALRPVRDVDRLPSMPSASHAGITSQPESPTTPLLPPHLQLRFMSTRPTTPATPSRPRRRPSIRHQASTSATDTEDPNADSVGSDEFGEPDIADNNGDSDMQPTVNIQDTNIDEEVENNMLDNIEVPLGLVQPSESEIPDASTINLSRRTALDAMHVNTTPIPTRPTMAPAMRNAQLSSAVPRYMLDRPVPPAAQFLAAMPRDEDVLMALQLLAYVSKYCHLRSFFQNSHLVPKLKIGKELHLLDGDISCAQTANCDDESMDDEEEDEEYILPDDFNIFPLVEKFTVRHHSHDMQYWAGVVMRNLCRKDEHNGGIRQCAYYQCGKWEEYARQFAKCRRCRRTKYCSKECQKSAWVYHRHWCVAASQETR